VPLAARGQNENALALLSGDVDTKPNGVFPNCGLAILTVDGFGRALYRTVTSESE
jgi:hypothetical protein